MSINPYQDLPSEAFWKSAVGSRQPEDIENLWTPRFPLSVEQRVATAGSCFAQHIGRALAAAGFTWLDGEPAPFVIPENERARFGYGVFSFRVGNIYTVALLRQWLEWAFGEAEPSDEVWEQDGRYYDPFRPVIEPSGFRSAAEMLAMREVTLAAIRRVVTQSNVFVFTLGLTEGWVNSVTGHVYPMCPGTTTGRSFDPAQDRFVNFAYADIKRDLDAALALMRSVNPDIRFLLTVSPVPLTATAAGKHVLVSTIYSKSVLRGVAGEVASLNDDTDYFPSYEIISSFPFGGRFYDTNRRTVRAEGVRFVMRHFFAGIGVDTGEPLPRSEPRRTPAQVGDGPNTEHGNAEQDVICEEALLEAFGR